MTWALVLSFVKIFLSHRWTTLINVCHPALFSKKKCRACCWISRKRYALSDLETLNSKNSVYYHHVILLLTCDVLIKVFSVDNILLKIIKLITGNQIDCSPELARLGMLTRTHTHTHWIKSRWRHNGHDSVSNHQPHDCLLNRLFRRRSKKTSKLRVTGLCVGNSPGPVNSPHKWPVTWKMFPFDDVIMRC